MEEIDKVRRYRQICRNYLQEAGPQHKLLYWECMPTQLIDSNYTVEFQITSVEWKNNYSFSAGRFSETDVHAGEPFEEFKETAVVKMKVVFKTSIFIPIEHQTEVDFRLQSFIWKASIYYQVFSNTPYSTAFENLHENLIRVQNRFNLRAIEGTEFQGQTVFGFYTDVVRRQRNSQPTNEEIQDGTFLDKITHAHGEVAVCVSNVLACFPMTGNLTDKMINNEGENFYLPNINYFDYQFYMWCSFTFERLYTYWELLIVLLYNFDDLQMNSRKLSLGSYFREMSKRIKATKPIKFIMPSQNHQWLQTFSETDYLEILKYRHRIVHHEFSQEHEGLLSAKFYINAQENVANKQGLTKFEQEIRQLPGLLIKQFELCKVGFEKTLLLIDELP